MEDKEILTEDELTKIELEKAKIREAKKFRFLCGIGLHSWVQHQEFEDGTFIKIKCQFCQMIKVVSNGDWRAPSGDIF